MGAWWPAPSAALRAAAQHWATWAMQKQELARNLISQHDLLLRNQGRTAEDLIGRYLRGAKSEVTKAEKYEIKKGAFNTAADAIDYLRSRLTGIAGEGNKEIDDVLASKKPLPEHQLFGGLRQRRRGTGAGQIPRVDCLPSDQPDRAVGAQSACGRGQQTGVRAGGSGRRIDV